MIWVFLCEDQFENVMTAVFEAWSLSTKVGHDNVRLVWKSCYQPTIFDECKEVETDRTKADRVIQSIHKKISEQAFLWIFRAAMSCEEDAPDAIYRFMILGYMFGGKVTKMLTEPAVIRLMELNRKVGNEFSSFREFARFTSLDGALYISHIEPKSNVVLMVAEHFADRMPSENFVIIDDGRRLAAVHPKEEPCYLRYLTEVEFNMLAVSEGYEDAYTDMWRTFFDAIAIKERKNPTCQMNHLPLWKRPHMTEFRDGVSKTREV